MLARALLRRFPVLAIRDFRYLLADRFLAPSAFGFSTVGVSFAVLGATGSTANLSYVLAAQIAPSLVFALVGGVIADRIPPQNVIWRANFLVAVGEGTLGLLVLTHHPQLWQMMVLEGLTGTAVAIFYPASQALLPAGARRRTPGGQRDQPARPERREDGRRGGRGPLRRGGRTRLGAEPSAGRPGGRGLAAAVHPGGRGGPNAKTPGMLSDLREGW